MLFPKATHFIGADWGLAEPDKTVAHLEVGEDGMLYRCEPPAQVTSGRAIEISRFRSRRKAFKSGMAIFGWVTLAAYAALVIMEGGWL